MRVNTDKLSCEYSSGVSIWGVRLKTFIVTKNLTCRSCWHWGQKEWVYSSILHNILSKLLPVVPCCARLHIPEIKLELAFRKRWSSKRLVWFALFFCEFHRSLHCSMIDSLKDHFIDLSCLFIFECNSHHLESISETLDTDTNRSVPDVWVSCFFNWVVVSVDDFV